MNQSSKYAQNIRFRCNKLNHKQQIIQFICREKNCDSSTRAGCIACVAEHDGHTAKNVDADDFFREIFIKERQVNREYQANLGLIECNKIRDSQIRYMKNQLSTLNQFVQAFFDRHTDFLTNYIINKLKSNEDSQETLTNYMDQLELIKSKPLNRLEDKDIIFYLDFLYGNQYENISSHNQQLNKENQEFIRSLIQQIMPEYQNIIQQAMNSVDIMIQQKTGLIPVSNIASPTKAQNLNQNIKQQSPPSYNLIQNTQIQLTQKSLQQQQQSNKKSQSLKKNIIRDKSPLIDMKQQVKQPAAQRFLISTVESVSEKQIQQSKELENFIIFLQLNYLSEDYLNEQFKFLVQNYPESILPALQIQDQQKYLQKNEIPTRLQQRERFQLIQELKAHLLKLLWDNWMIDWLHPAINQDQHQRVVIKVHEIDENYNGFLELLDKSLQMHYIVVWLVKQKLNRPKAQYHTWLILAQNTQKQLKNQKDIEHSSQNKIYRIYHIKSAIKKDYREYNIQGENEINSITKSMHAATLAKVLQDNLHGEFILNDDSKVLIKGLTEPNFQIYLLSERLQLFLDLCLIHLQIQKLPYNIYSIENILDKILINFQGFVDVLYDVLQESKDQN